MFKSAQPGPPSIPYDQDMTLPFVFGALVLVGLVIVAVKTFRNGAPTDSIAQVLHDVEHPAAVPVPVTARRP